MIEVQHIYSLKSHWLHGLADQLGARIINEKLFIMPNSIADGGFFFTEVAPGLSVVIWDITFKKSINIRRIKSNNSLYIIHFDFSDEINLISVDGKKEKINYKANLGLSVFDNDVESLYQPIVGDRIFAMRLLVSKKMLSISTAASDFNKKNNNIKKDKDTLYFWDHIDSKSKIILHAIKNKTFSDPAFEIYLRGASLRLFSKFIDRYYNLEPMLHHASEIDVQALNKTKEYLLNNLFGNFPGVPYLADMAGMSVSKYKLLFKKMLIDTPSSFFLREKMILANELLQSKNFDTISEIAAELNYSKITTFNSSYFKHFKRKVSDDFLAAYF